MPDYAVTFRGVPSDALRAAFDDCTVEAGDASTTLRCTHAALHGVLTRIQDLGLELLAIDSTGPAPDEASP